MRRSIILRFIPRLQNLVSNDEEVDAAYDGQLPTHLIAMGMEVSLDEARFGSICD
jgi:hypothetical protein